MKAARRPKQQAEWKDSVQRTKPPPGLEHLGYQATGGISSSSSMTFVLDPDADNYGEAMHSLFGPFDSDDNVSPHLLDKQYQPPAAHSTT